MRKGGKAPPTMDSQRYDSSTSLFVEIHYYLPKTPGWSKEFLRALAAAY
jgi:hypothetical protein